MRRIWHFLEELFTYNAHAQMQVKLPSSELSPVMGGRPANSSGCHVPSCSFLSPIMQANTSDHQELYVILHSML
jgi:hypothetical protein